MVNCSFKQENSLVYSGTYSTKLSDIVFFFIPSFLLHILKDKVESPQKDYYFSFFISFEQMI